MQTTNAPRMSGYTTELPPAELYRCEEAASGVATFDNVEAEQVALFREQGFLVIEQAFTEPEIAAAQAGLRDLLAGRVEGDFLLQYEPKAQAILEELTAEERADAVRKLMDFARFEPRLAALADHAKLLRVVERILGEPPTRFQDMALLKPPRLGCEKPWHQDHAYFDYPLGTPIVGVWIALDEATQENGCMALVPGGHRAGPRWHFQRRDWQICDSEMFGLRRVAVPLRPGGCLLFDGLLPHGTPPNLSPRRRRAVQFHYCPASAQKTSLEARLELFGAEGKDVSC
jgi:phytanoyl-CoA hydroxylase